MKPGPRRPLLLDDAPDPFQAALGRYGAAFPGEGLPFLRGVQPADQPMVAALLDLAVAMGQPLPWSGVMTALGYPLPPDGVHL
jgi:hypothetical protein